MKIYRYSSQKALILVTTCLLGVSSYSVNQAIGAETQARRDASTESAVVRPAKGAARLIIHRIPNLGNRVIVDLSIDGAPVASIAYGHTYEGFLPPGRHVLSVRPTPNPKWTTASEVILDVQNGRTYNFTAMGDHSGYLILKGA
jgi:hypothetical protein